MRTLTQEQGLAAPLARHALVETWHDPSEVATSTVGLHATSQTSPYLSLLARVDGFDRGQLDTLMWANWDLVRFRAMRLTMFLMPHDLLEVAAAATHHASESLAARWLRDSGMSLSEYSKVAASIRKELAAQPMTVRALRKSLSVPPSVDLPGVVGRMCDAGELVGGAPPRNWRSNVRQYHLWETVLPGVQLHRWNEAPAIRKVVLRYVRAYGPVTINDISWWSGFTKHQCRRALRSLRTVVEEVEVTGWPDAHYCARDVGPDRDVGDRVVALPILDPYVQGYRDRSRLIDAERLDYVYDGGGNSTATVVHRGKIIGVWQIVDGEQPVVRYHLFDPQSARVSKGAEAALARAGELYFDRGVDVIPKKTMQPLSHGGGRSAWHPLDRRTHRASRRSTPERS